MIKFSHSIFALPFALGSLFLATQNHPPLKLLILVVLAMVTARNVAMAFNRLVDAKFDALNPRTAIRHIPKGLLTRNFVMLFTIVNAALFFTVCFFINKLSFLLSPLALIILCLYSLTKRFTHFTQIFLGIALGIAPIAAWIAATGQIEPKTFLLGAAVLFWVAGFDILYSTQDYDFDKSHQLKSLAVLMGISGAFWLARVSHLISLICFIWFGLQMGLQTIYFVGIILIGVMLIVEHSIVSPKDLSKINVAFFTFNGIISFVFLICTILDQHYFFPAR